MTIRALRHMVPVLLIVAATNGRAQVAGPDGGEWEDPARQSLGTLPSRSYFASFPDVASAMRIRPETSPWRISLDSETDWRFSWCRRPSQRPTGFFRPEYDVSSWDVVKVPCSWQSIGIRKSGERFEVPLYIDPKYAFAPEYPQKVGPGVGKVMGHPIPSNWTFGSEDNPVGSYRRDFQLPEDWLRGDRIVLRFDGVSSFYYLWVNGTYVGFSKSSRDAAEFDVTELVKNGRNVVAVEVYRNSDGAWLESMDMWRMSGIFRSVSIHRVPQTHVRDVTFVTTPVRKGVYDGDWALDLHAEKVGSEPRMLDVKVFDSDGKAVEFSGSVGFDSRLVFRRPELWSAEAPNLYTLILEIKDADRRTVEAIPFQLGFREVEIRGELGSKDRTFLFNGKPIKLKGANRHESDPMYGHYTSEKRILEDVRILKEGNFNMVRTCHYPQPGFFYYLANKYGLYVIDEANMESHATSFGKTSLSHDPSWREAHLRRVRNLVERDKCQPCVVIWSLGNEAGPGDNFRHCYEWVRTKDPTRPVHYEGNNDYADMGSCMYPSVPKVWSIAVGEDGFKHNDKPVKYPFVLCEYAHNLAHGVGNLKDFQQAIESSDRVMGGAVWDFADQALYAVDSRGRRFLAFSGDFGERPEDGLDGINGYVLADRRPEPSYYEAQHVFRPFRASRSSNDRRIRVENVNFFRDASGCVCRMTVLSDGRPVGDPIVRSFDLPPQSSREIDLPISIAELLGRGKGIVSVRVEFLLKEGDGLLPDGWVVARDQIDFGGWSTPVCAEGSVVVRESEARIVFLSDGIEYGFDRLTGSLVSFRKKSRELLLKPVMLDVFRAPMGGDTEKHVDGWMRNGLRTMLPIEAEISSIRENGSSRVFTVHQRFRGERSERLIDYQTVHPAILDVGPISETNTVVAVETVYAIRPDGSLEAVSRFHQEVTELEPPRMGWRFVFVGGNETVEWFGRGPIENYPDCGAGSVLGRWSLPLKKFQFPYGRNEDSGNRECVYEVVLRESGAAIRAIKAPFAFMASAYSPTELIEEPHFEFLSVPSKTELGVYAKVRGLGSDNCGPAPLERDCIRAKDELHLSFTLSADSWVKE